MTATALRRAGGITFRSEPTDSSVDRSPIVLLMPQGCSRSIVLFDKLQQVLGAHGVKTFVTEQDSIKPAAEDQVLSLNVLQNLAKKRGERLLLKVFAFHFKHPGLVHALRSMGARVLVAVENNALDDLVCAVDHCYINSEVMGFNVDPIILNETAEAHVGGCFHKERASDLDRIPLVHLDSRFTRFYLSKSKENLGNICRIANIIDACGPKNAYYVSALLEHETDLSPGMMTQVVQRWHEVLAHLRVAPNDHKIEDVLSSSRPSALRPFGTHRARIANYDEIAKDLQDTSFRKLLRYEECPRSTCSPEDVSPL